MIKSKTGISNDKDAFEAGKEAAQQAKKGMAGIEPELVLVSASSTYDQEKVLAGIDSVFPDVPLAGGSPLGGVITDQGIEDTGVALMALKFEKTKFAFSFVENLFENPTKAGMELGEKLLNECEEIPKLVMIFPASTFTLEKGGVSLSSFLEGVRQKIGQSASIMGGVTGNDLLFTKGKFDPSFQYFNKTVKQNTVLAIGFWGDFSFSLGIKHGWEPIGLEMKVTKSKPGVVQEIDGKPAIEVYEKYLEKTKEEILNPQFFTIKGTGYFYPFGIILKEPDRIVISQTAGATPKGEIIALAPIPEGSTIRIMQVQAKKMPQIAEQIAQESLIELKGKTPDLVFLISCLNRKLFLIPDQETELSAIKKIIGEKVPIFGYWSAGEVGSKSEEKEWLMHNDTIVLGLIRE